MINRIAALMLILLAMVGCTRGVITESPAEIGNTQAQSSEEFDMDDTEAIKYIKKLSGDLRAISGNLSYYSDLLRVTIEDETISEIAGNVLTGLEYGSDEYLEHLTGWIREGVLHTQFHEEYKNHRNNEPWNGTFKTLLPYEMKKLGSEKNTYMGKCTSIANLAIGLLRESGLHKDDYVVIEVPEHTLAIFEYSDGYYLVDNNDIYPVTDEIMEGSPLVLGYYHEDS